MDPADRLQTVADTAATLRQRLESHFAADTAAPGTGTPAGSAGHCAATALIFHQLFGGDLVSAFVDSTSHWFNRLEVGGKYIDVDLTGDQFGLAEVRVACAGHLFPGTRVRRFEDAHDETLARAAKLASRAGLSQVEEALREALRKRVDQVVEPALTHLRSPTELEDARKTSQETCEKDHPTSP